MRVLSWVLRFLLFVLLFLLALKNATPVALHAFFGQVWQIPLSLLLLGFFAAGALLGVLAVVASLLRARRQIAGLQREIARLSTTSPPSRPAPEA